MDLDLSIINLSMALLAQGQGQNINLGQVQGNKGVPITTTLNQFMQNLFTLVFSVAAIAVLIYMIWGAYDWITSGGDKDKIAAARKKIVNALIGLAVLALAFFIVTVVGNIVGFNILTNLQIPFLGQ